MIRIEYEAPDQICKACSADEYIDKIFMKEYMLPISKDYTLSLVDTFLIHHVLELIKKKGFKNFIVL